MQILVDSDNSNCGNMGDVAMLQVAVARLRSLWPSASIQVLTQVPDLVALHCPGVVAVPANSRHTWLVDDYLLGRLHTMFPESISLQLRRLKKAGSRHTRNLVEAAIRVKTQLRRLDGGDPRIFLDAVTQADLLVVCGLGGMTDSAKAHSYLVLDTLELAIQHHVPTAMFSQGIGPVQEPALRGRMQTVLPNVDIIALRERRSGVPLLTSLGVAQGRLFTTGDDAIELAYQVRTDQIGQGVGINLRVAAYAGVDHSFIDKLRSPLHEFAHMHHAPLVPVPITRHKYAPDSRTIRQLLVGYDDLSDGGVDLDTPRKVIEQVSRCRLVVTGAYHAAVFALAQGIPTVCLAVSQYYVGKFCGLADMFGDGCQVLYLDGTDFQAQFVNALERGWQSAEEVRLPLQKAGARQTEAGRAAYAQLPGLLVALMAVA